MTTTPSAAASGTFRIGGDITVHRLGFGAMRITGAGIWGEPEDRGRGAAASCKRLPELGVNFIDTADSYGPFVSEDLIAEALAPYDGHAGRHQGRPDAARARHLGAGRPARISAPVRADEPAPAEGRAIDLWQLHRIDPKVPRDEQFGVIADMLKEGLIRHAGLSEVSVEEIEAARKFFPVATVQNLYNLDRPRQRGGARLLRGATTSASSPGSRWPPATSPSPARRWTPIAHKANATPSQIALAWVLKRSPVMLPIPGTSKVDHLEDNVRAAGIELSDQDFKALDAQAKATA